MSLDDSTIIKYLQKTGELDYLNAKFFNAVAHKIQSSSITAEKVNKIIQLNDDNKAAMSLVLKYLKKRNMTQTLDAINTELANNPILHPDISQEFYESIYINQNDPDVVDFLQQSEWISYQTTIMFENTDLLLNEIKQMIRKQFPTKSPAKKARPKSNGF